MILVLLFFSIWVGVSYFLSLESGWHELKKHYMSTEQYKGKTLSFITGELNGAYFNQTLKVGLNEQGVFIGVIFPFNFGSPDLLIPLKDLTVETIRTGWFGSVLLTLKKHNKKAEFKLSHRTALKLEKLSGITLM